jgi:hypothetical protein
VVTAAKELGISQGFPPGGQYTEAVLKRSLFNNSISAKKLLYRSEKNNVKKRGNMLISPRNFRIAAGHKLK